MEVLGIPLRYDNGFPHPAAVKWIGPWKCIVVGPPFFALSSREQQAVLMHEVHHCKARHMEWRLLVALIPMAHYLPIVQRKARQQEFDADQFAAEHGYGSDLARLLDRKNVPSSEFYPSHKERIDNLLRHIGRLANANPA